MATNSGGWLYETNGTPVDKATADNAQARVLEIKQSADTASTDAAKALQTANSYAGQIAQANTTAGEAKGIAQGAEDTADNAVTRVAQIETMAGLAPGEVTDAQTANLISQPGTATRDALNAATAQAIQVGGEARPVLDEALAPKLDSSDAAMIYATKSEVTTELKTRAAPVVADIISTDPSIAQAAANLAQSDAGLTRQWPALNGQPGDANTKTAPGTYPNGWSDATTNEAMGLPKGAGPGVLEVLRINAGVITHRYTTARAGEVTCTRTLEAGGAWSAWVAPLTADGGSLAGTAGAADAQLLPGFYRNGWPASYSKDQGLPANAGPGILEVQVVSPSLVLQRYMATSPVGMLVRSLSGTTWSAWTALADAASVAATYATKADLAGIETSTGDSASPRGLYQRTRPTPDGGTGTITPLAMDPNKPGRMWSQGSRFAQLGYGPVDGSSFTPITVQGLPLGTAITGLYFSSTHLWATMGPMTPGQGSVRRSPLPAAEFTGATGHGITFTKAFDLTAPPAGITVGDKAYWRNSSLATDPTGQRVMLLEYGAVITGGPSLYFSKDAGATWVKAYTWANGKHGHAVRYFDFGNGGEWWVQNGDASFADLGMWSAPDKEPFVWTRRSTRQVAGVDEYGINMFPIETAPGVIKMVSEADTHTNNGPLFLPLGTPDMAREYLPSAKLPAEHKGTMRQLTYDPETGNLYWYQTSELGVLGTTDSIWMLPPPYGKPVLLESFPYQGTGGETQGDPVIYGDYFWLGRNRIRKEMLTTQV